MRACAVLFAVVCLAAAGGWSSAIASYAWEPELYLQLQGEHGCEPEFLTNVSVQVKEDGQGVVRVRAHCRDGRAFDAVREDMLLPFILRRCNVFAEA
jgi:hypothetical protein